MNLHRWLAHFKKNRERRPDPDWGAPVTLPAAAVQPLVRSLEQLQLGDGGGPGYLIAWDREQFLSASEGTRELVDLWFAEEWEHSRLLGAAVARFGGQPIRGHWSFTAFCLTRRWLGVRFELTVLLLTEIVSTVYYRLLRRHGRDAALPSMCRLIMRDEAGQVAFHRDRLARAGRSGRARYGAAGTVSASLVVSKHCRICPLPAEGRGPDRDCTPFRLRALAIGSIPHRRPGAGRSAGVHGPPADYSGPRASAPRPPRSRPRARWSPTVAGAATAPSPLAAPLGGAGARLMIADLHAPDAWDG
jgi:hypothetical protein